ncbi:MAG TPA: helix-hairpin-helix domain-containing protein [Ferruginibacter sp.]|nr:helix-hairpin-helix domain-containing protein [Ferruginibacter sp.]
MKRLIIISVLFFISLHVRSQVEETTANTVEQQLENNTENNEDVETEDDGYLQQMQQFLKHPVDLNRADVNDLSELRILTPLQVQHLIVYRGLVGKLIDVYELQALPGWDLHTIRKLRPYVTVSLLTDATGSLKSRLKKGEHTLLLRASQVLERSKGYLLDSSTATNFYPGSPQKIMFRYKYNYRNLLQYGMLAEKDAGEQFFKGKQKTGFDFYSFHLFVRKTGIIQSLAIGDFAVNMGQGLVQWQSLAFKKSADVLNIKRESPVLRPYNSAAETNFHRGVGITIKKNAWQATAFISYKKIDANFVADTSGDQNAHVSSLQTSGYHRTKSEAADKGIQTQLVFGANLSYQYKRWQLGLNGIHYKFKLPLARSPNPYNRYALSGKNSGNYSFDYSYTFRNIHFFGELAFTSSTDMAFTGGLMASVSSVADLAVLYRNISRSYQSLYTSAFTENTYPANEKGLYAGISIRPVADLRIDAYADLYKFPWLKYRVDAPSGGSDYRIQLTYSRGKRLEIYTRYHSGSKSINSNPANLTFSSVSQQAGKNWRTQVSYRISPDITLRNRTEMVWFDRAGPAPEEGFLIFFDILYRPVLKPFSGNLRLQYFETDGYSSRLYAYENDVLYGYSIPVFHEKGHRYYININYEPVKNVSVWLRWAQTVYTNKTFTGSGLDEIPANHKSEIKIQALYKF